MIDKLTEVKRGTTTSTDIEASLAEYNIQELESQLVTAQQRRTDLLLTGSDAEILSRGMQADQ